MITVEELDRARKSKKKLQSLYKSDKVSVGITKVGEEFALKINLKDWPDLAVFPEEFEGYQVITEIVGNINKC